jgi:hypothetical protein
VKPRYTTLRVDVGARRYVVDVKVIPPRAPAHAVAGSSRFLDPGSVGIVEIKRVRRNGLDVTDAVDPDLRLLLRDRCARAAGVGRSSAPQRGEQALLEFQR